MSERLIYVWRLVVTLPEGSDASGWRPVNYDNRAYYRDDEAPFRWPVRRLWLSSPSAYRRANLLRSWGATVEVHRSACVDGWEKMHG